MPSANSTTFQIPRRRALVSGRSGLFGLIVSEITNPFFPELIQGFEDVAVANGYEILVSSTNYDPKRMRFAYAYVGAQSRGCRRDDFGIEQPLLEATRGTQHPPGVRRFGGRNGQPSVC